ncbi:hypothetical protein C1646_315371 [Rhizophagus diaphanus]|nr:hypothetical protein C1646_315371 [Rhizophagus diaphanus] [Rhizophagus sp. MUCL 43196]
MEQNFNLIYRTSFENNSFLELQKYCTDLMSKYPDKILKSLDFSSAPEKILISIIQSDNLQMSEIQVWENVLKWGLAQNPGLSSNPSNYSKDDFNSLKNTLKSCIPFIRFYNLTSQEFSDHILPYKEVLPEELYMDLLKTFLSLNPNSKPGHKSNPRMTKEITPPSPPRPSYSYSTNPFNDLDKQPQLSSSSSNYRGDLIDFSTSTLLNLNLNSNPSHKSSPRMTKEITPPRPSSPRLSSSSSNYNVDLVYDRNAKEITPPRPSTLSRLSSSSSNYKEDLFDSPASTLLSLYPNSNPSYKSSPRMTTPPPPPKPPILFNDSYKISQLSSSSSNYNGDLFDSSASTLLSLNPNSNLSHKSDPPPRLTTSSYFDDLHKLPRLSSISSNYNGDLFDSSASNYQVSIIIYQERYFMLNFVRYFYLKF